MDDSSENSATTASARPTDDDSDISITTTADSEDISIHELRSVLSSSHFSERTRSSDSGITTSWDEQLNYRYKSYIQQDRGHVKLYSVQFNNYLNSSAPNVFAVVGGNQIAVYEINDKAQMIGSVCFRDPDLTEDFYTCCWSMDTSSKCSVVLAAGVRGIIRVLQPHNPNLDEVKSLIGHGEAVNQLKISPVQPFLLASSSKDHSIRLWNIETCACIATFHGEGSHRDEVVTIDFNFDGTRLVSGGLDHAIAIWDISMPNIRSAIEKSQRYNRNDPTTKFKVVFHPFPIFRTRNVHKNYIDCIQWHHNLILSKSNVDDLLCWMPGHFPSDAEIMKKPPKDGVAILTEFDIDHCEYYFVRFATNSDQSILAIGNSLGRVRLFNMNANLNDFPYNDLSHPKCKGIIRELSFSRCGRDLVFCCDNGTVWLYQRHTK